MPEQATMRAVVVVQCLGIVNTSGFSLSPEGIEPKYYDFVPGKGTSMPKPYADFLVAQDPTKFVVVEGEPEKTPSIEKQAEPAAAPAKKLTFAERMKAAKAAKSGKTK